MTNLALLSRIAHILAAITLVGGTFYQCAVVVPVFRNTEDSGGEGALRNLLRGRWTVLVMASALFLLVSGFYNYVLAIRADRAGVTELPAGYHPIIGTKIILAMVIFLLASLLAGRSSASEKMRDKASVWLTVNSLLAVVIVCLASYLKIAGQAF